MRGRLIGLCFIAMLFGCASGEPSQEDRDACAAAGHSPGSPAFETCLEERLEQRFQRPAGADVDDLRVRMGPRVRTGL